MLRDLFPKPGALALALVLIAGAVLAIEQPWREHSGIPPPPEGIPASELQYPAAPDFRGATGWVGTSDGEPLYLEDLRGKVVLVDFWTYSCINCIHTFPYVEGWYERYKDDGLVVVGVHTPEFRFEREAANVQDARERYGLTYPTAQDNDYGIWQAYANRYWPAKYLIDEWGRIRYTHFGEGDYAATEQRIRDLLTEAGHPPTAAMAGSEAMPSMRHTPELYAAAAQGLDRVAIGNPEGYHPGRTIDYARPPTPLKADRIFLVDRWANGEESDLAEGNASVLVRFTAGAANFVADGPQGACVRVLLDGAPITAALAGPDVNLTAPGGPCIPLDGPRSYDFFTGPGAEHTVELQAPSGFELFTFAFSSSQRGA
jgi:thiol-disulfide isomerase/thioredoxin